MKSEEERERIKKAQRECDICYEESKKKIKKVKNKE